MSLPKPYYEHDGITIYHGDCRKVLPALSQIDLTLTDPPYSDQTHDGALTNRATGIEQLVTFKSITVSELRGILDMVGKVTQTWVLAFMDYAHVVALEPCPPDGLRSVRFGIWVKDNPIPQLSGDRPAQGFEAIGIYHRKGGRMKWNGGGRPAVWRYPIASTNRLHPTEKPIRLIKHLLTDFSEPSMTILDPFMGSGTTLRAAKDLRRKAIGIEIEEKYCEIAAKRLEQEVFDFA